MGKRNYLIEGVSGSGKTAVATELQSRGFQAIHGDRELAYLGDPETGGPATPEPDLPIVIWRARHWIWDLEKVKSYIANKEELITFFCGGSRNHSNFIGLLDSVFILDVDRDTMLSRVDKRVKLDPTDFGGKPEERELVKQLHATKEQIPSKGTIIDATQPLTNVVEEILGYVQGGNTCR